MNEYGLNPQLNTRLSVNGELVDIKDGVPRVLRREKWKTICRTYPNCMQPCIQQGLFTGFCRLHRPAVPEGWDAKVIDGVTVAVKGGVARRQEGKDSWRRVCAKFPECTRFRPKRAGAYCYVHASAPDNKKTKDLVHVELFDGVPHKMGVFRNGAMDWMQVCKLYPKCLAFAQSDDYCKRHDPGYSKPERANSKTNVGLAAEHKAVTVWEAIKDDKATSLRNLLADIDIDAMGPMLIKAAEGGKLHCLRAMLDYGVDIESQNTQQTTALSRACQEGHIQCVRMLIDAKANVNTANSSGASPLCRLRTSHNRLEIATSLIEGRADVNHSREDGRTALMTACRYDKTGQTVTQLLQHGAFIDFRSHDGNTAMTIAYKYKNRNAIAALTYGERYAMRTPMPITIPAPAISVPNMMYAPIQAVQSMPSPQLTTPITPDLPQPLTPAPPSQQPQYNVIAPVSHGMINNMTSLPIMMIPAVHASQPIQPRSPSNTTTVMPMDASFARVLAEAEERARKRPRDKESASATSGPGKKQRVKAVGYYIPMKKPQQ